MTGGVGRKTTSSGETNGPGARTSVGPSWRAALKPVGGATSTEWRSLVVAAALGVCDWPGRSFHRIVSMSAWAFFNRRSVETWTHSTPRDNKKPRKEKNSMRLHHRYGGRPEAQIEERSEVHEQTRPPRANSQS